MKIFIKIVVILILTLWVKIGFSQISGTKTIGGASPDYTTIQEAVDSLESQGVSGAVTMNIRQGTYNEQVTIGTIPGVSSSDSILFKTAPGSSSMAKIIYGTDYTIKLRDSASYISFDSLNIETSGNASVVKLEGAHNHLGFYNNSFVGRINASSVVHSCIYDNNAFVNYLVIEGNTFRNGGNGILLGGTYSDREFNVTIKDNNIYDFSFDGIELNYVDTSTVVGNYVKSSNGSTAIYLRRCRYFQILGNEFYARSQPIICDYSQGSLSSYSLIANNMFSQLGSTNSDIVFYNVNYCDIVFNSFYGQINSTSSALVLLSGGNLNFRNNSIHNDSSGYALKVLSGTNQTRDYNNIYGNNGSNNLLGAVQLGANSISVNPDYQSDTNHTPTNVKLVGRGTSIPGISTDIFGNVRKSSPDIGAVEKMAPFNNAGISFVDVPSVCVGDTAKVSVDLENFGSNTISSCTINWAVSTNGGGYINQTPFNYSGGLSSFSDTTLLIGGYVYSSGNSYDIKVYSSSPNSGSDTVAYNDTSYAFFAPDRSIYIGLGSDDSICPNTPYVISANENTQYAYSWNNGETTPSITAADSTFEYVLKVTDQNNCVNTDTFKLTVFDEPIVRFDSTIQAACAFGDSIVLNHAIPVGGVYSGTNVNSIQGKLGPGTFGTYPVNYTYTDSNGCSGAAVTAVVIHKNPSVNLTNMADLCINSGWDTITENSPQDTLNGIFTGTGIVNDSIGVFDPEVAGVGVHSIAYTYTNPVTGCFSSDSNLLVVNDTFTISFSGPAEYCVNEGKVTLQNALALPTVFSSQYTGATAGIIGSRGFDPALAGAGSFNLTYTVTDTNNCLSTVPRLVFVDTIPLVTLTDTFFCFNAPDLILYTGSPAGGLYYNARALIDTAGGYAPSAAGIGLDTVLYAYTNTAGCSDTASEVYQIFSEPSVNLVLPQLNEERCIDAEPFNLTGQSPVSNVGVSLFSGIGVNNKSRKFKADSAGVGTHIVKFEYTDIRGCSDSAFDTVIVHDLPLVSILTKRDSICLNEIPDTVFGAPIGGTFSGLGIDSAGFLIPSTIGVTSSNVITYTYTDSNRCTNSTTDTFRIDSITPITLALIPDNCVNIDLDTLLQGSINSDNYLYKSAKYGSLTNGIYSPSTVGSGFDTITYIFENDFGCKDSLSQQVLINDTVTLSFNIPSSRNTVCENVATFNLASGLPNGGLYSNLTGPGLVGNKFSPKNAALGNNFIQYTYSDTNNCISRKVDTIEVNATTPITHFGDTFCINEGLRVLNGGSINSGTYRYTGSGMINDTVFAPAAAGIGTKTITYFYTNNDGCTSQANALYGVNAAPVNQFNNLSPVCLNADTFSIKGASTSGNASYFYNSTGFLDTISGLYLPANAGVGTETIGFVGLNISTGCSDTLFRNLVIHAIPNTVLDTFPDFCVNDAPIVLSQGTPIQNGIGVYSGAGVVGSQFFPSLAKVGNHVLTYKYTDGNNCSVSDTEVVVVNALPVLTPATLLDLCQFDTSIVLTGALPAGGYYKGVGVDSATSIFTPDSVGVWSIRYYYADANGCENSIAQNQQVRALPATTLSFNARFCDNDDPVQLTGGAPVGAGGSYFGAGVSGGFYDPQLVNDTIDTLVYIFTDIHGCSNSDSVTISFDSSANVTALQVPDICKGAANLDLNQYFSPSGGTFNGVNVFNGIFISSLLDTGSYKFSYNYLDSNNCVSTLNDSVVIRPNPSFTLSADTGICQGDIIQLIADGDYSYNWSTGDYLATAVVRPQKTESYAVTATNAFNCTTTKTVAVTVFDQINVYSSFTNAICGKANGSAFTSVTGGTKPYQYVWSNGQRTNTARNLFAGSYQVTVSDKNGCLQYGSVGVNAEGGPKIDVVSKVNNTCAGDNSGEIEVAITADTSYTLKWNSGATGTKLTGLSTGLYELSVISVNGCNSYQSINITSPKAYEYDLITSQPDCDSTNGSALLVVNNSLDTLNYSWLGQPSGDTLKNVGPGLYTAVATNNLGCVDSVDVILENVFAPIIKLDSIQEASCGQANGFIAVSGVNPISKFNWSNGDTTGVSRNLAVGFYTVTATDTGGCSTVEQYVVLPDVPNDVSICKVTNDSALGNNVISWDTTGITGVDSFIVYRESGVRNEYFELGKVGRFNAPAFTDEALDNKFAVGKYFITAGDACEFESNPSVEHQSILLSTTQSDSTIITLNWTDYRGYNYDKYYVYRYSTEFGTELLDSSNTFNSYADYNMPTTSEVVYYYIGIKGQTICADTGLTTISNHSRDYGRKLVGVALEKTSRISFTVWPNPTNGILNLKVGGFAEGNSTITVFDMQGKIMYRNEYDSGLLEQTQSIHLSELSSGMYYVQFVQDNVVMTREIVINR